MFDFVMDDYGESIRVSKRLFLAVGNPQSEPTTGSAILWHKPFPPGGRGNRS